MKISVRALLEKMAYAGLKPSGGAGGNRLDPLYLSNRSTARKILTACLIVLPFALIGTGVYLAAIGYFSTPTPPPSTLNPTRDELAAKVLSNLKDVRIESEQLIKVMDARITRGATVSLDGTLKNNVTRLLRSVEVSFDLTNAAGSQLGAVTVHLDKLESEAITNFHLPLKQRDAAHAIFREARSQ